MIVGLGTDICQIARIAASLDRHGERLVRRVLHEREMADWDRQSPAARPRFLARRFAAKEAAVKALGTGARDGVALNQVAIGHDALGRPLLNCSDRAAQVMAALGSANARVSISDERDYAVAVVVLEAPDN